jgi:hypothetical protein
MAGHGDRQGNSRRRQETAGRYGTWARQALTLCQFATLRCVGDVEWWRMPGRPG